MAYCCVPGCESHRWRDCDRDLSFHRFPVDLPTRREWEDRITMLQESVDPYFQVTVNSKVCGRHFTEDCKLISRAGLKKLRKGSVPTVFTGCRPGTRRSVHTPRRDPQRLQEMKATAAETVTETHLHEVAQVLCDHNYWKKPLTASEQLQAAQMELDDLEEKGRELESEQFFLQRLQSEPELIRFYTGFKDYSTLKALYLALQPTADTIWNWCRTLKLDNSEGNAVDRGFHAHHLCLFDQLFMFLCFVRRGFLPINMSKQFKVSEATVQTTCITWCHYLFFMLGTVPVWPSRRAVDELMPTFFRTTFPKTRVVLHMTEFHVQMVPSTANSSLHKASTALKSVVGITPSGSVSFVGSVCSASISDKDIIGDSGVLNLLESGDQVMAAKSLDIKELLDLIDVNLVVPAFSGPDRRLNKEDVTHTQHMSHLKIHIERAIGRITKYQIFDDVVPAALCGSVNQLWTVCALLTNFQGPLQ